MMNELIDIPAELYDEEVICYLAERYHSSPREVVRCFLWQEEGGNMFVETPPAAFRLEENEMEILRGLTHVSRSLKRQ